MTWIVVPNWPKFQHYHDRSPAWIKLYLELRSRDDWRRLTLAAQGLLVNIWIEYAASNGQLRTNTLSQRIPQKFQKKTFASLVEAGFIRVRASKPLANSLALTRVREEKRREEPPLPPKPRPQKVTGWRLVRGTHGITHVPDPLGTDTPPFTGRPM